VPEAEIKRRGGAVKWRTKKLPGGKYVHVAVTREAGPRGGRTVAGPVHKKKKRQQHMNEMLAYKKHK